jgi:hypothetical protein
MNTLEKAKFVQQCYKLVTLSHMATKAFDTIYQQNLYSLVRDTNVITDLPDYTLNELRLMQTLSEITMSISDMCSCMRHGNSEGFDKIFEQVSQDSAALIIAFNEINDAVNRASGSSSKNNGETN